MDLGLKGAGSTIARGGGPTHDATVTMFPIWQVWGGRLHSNSRLHTNVYLHLHITPKREARNRLARQTVRESVGMRAPRPPSAVATKPETPSEIHFAADLAAAAAQHRCLQTSTAESPLTRGLRITPSAPLRQPPPPAPTPSSPNRLLAPTPHVRTVRVGQDVGRAARKGEKGERR